MATPLFLRRRYWRNSVQEGVVQLVTLELNSGQFEANLGWLQSEDRRLRIRITWSPPRILSSRRIYQSDNCKQRQVSPRDLCRQRRRSNLCDRT